MPTSELDRRLAARAESRARRTKTRLRELCDEVLASRRVAMGHDPITPVERDEAASLLRSWSLRA